MEDVDEDDNSAELRRAIRDSDLENCVDIVNKSIVYSDTSVELGNLDSAGGLTKVKRSRTYDISAASLAALDVEHSNGDVQAQASGPRLHWQTFRPSGTNNEH